MSQAFAQPLAASVIGRSNVASNAVLVLTGSAFVALCAQISVPLAFTPVPLTGQTFAVLIVAGALGIWRGALSLALYVGAGAAGAPIYAGGAHGAAVLTSATGGYLVGFVVAAVVVGALAQRGWDRGFGTGSASMLAGSVIIYLVGVPWLAVVLDTNLEKSLELGLYPFVVGDVIKLYLAGALLPAAWRIVDRVRGDA
jgi:biotin transport system substrate-specific component